MKKINWAKIKEFFSRPKVIKWSIAVLTLLIVAGTIKALVWTIYTKDKPTFVPEEVREDIQGAIKETGEAIKVVSDPVGSAIVDAGYDPADDCPCLPPEAKESDVTANWPTYISEELGISFKYPNGWVVEKDSDKFVRILSQSDLLEYKELKARAADTGNPYWGSIAINISATDINVNKIAILKYVTQLFGEAGVTVKNIPGAIYVIDRGPDRYAGGVGYYYYKIVGSTVYEFSVDYFGSQDSDSTMLGNLRELMESSGA